MPLNLHEAAGLLVIGAVGVRPCLTALVLMVVSFLWAGTEASPVDAGSSTQKNRYIRPFNRAYPQGTGQPKSDAQPAADRMPEGTGDSVAAGQQIFGASDWAKTGVWGLPSAFLVTFCAYKKLPGSGPGRPGSHVQKRSFCGTVFPARPAAGASALWGRSPRFVPPERQKNRKARSPNCAPSCFLHIILSAGPPPGPSGRPSGRG